MREHLSKLWKDPVVSKLIAQLIINSAPICLTIITGFINQGYIIHTIWPLVAGILTLLLSLILIVVLIVLLFKEAYFRETFSLYSYVFQIGVISLFTGSIFMNLMPWDMAFDLKTGFFAAKDAHIFKRDYIFCFIIIIFNYIIISKYLLNWKGKISKRQFDEDERNLHPSLMRDAIIRIVLFLKSEKIVAYEYVQKEIINNITSDDIETLPWKNKAKELIMLKSNSYSFVDSDWHDLKNCWIGVNQHTQNIISIFPINFDFDIDYINSSISYVKSMALAKNKIVEEIIIAYAGNIEFNRLITSDVFLSIYSEVELLNSIANFADYKYKIHLRANVDTLIESESTLNDVFVSPKINVGNEKDTMISLEAFLNDWMKEPSRKHIALLGDYGQGKSTAALMFTNSLLNSNSDLPLRIPILFELRGKNLKDQEPVDLLGQWGGRYGISGKALLSLHEAGKLIIIFEGFDEMAQLSDFEVRKSNFKALWAFSAYPKGKIIITGRPNLFESKEELNAALGIQEKMYTNGSISSARCIPVKLLPFDFDQIEEALRVQKDHVREQIVSRAKSDSHFFEIISRPSLLHVVSVIWEPNNLHNATLNSADIIGTFVNNSYTRQALKEKEPFQFSSLNLEERSYFMSGVAAYMIANEINSITNQQLNDVVFRLLEEIPSNLLKLSSIRQESDVPLKKRLLESNKDTYDKLKIEQLYTDVRTSALLVVDPANTTGFRFGHKSFMEYLFAEVVYGYLKYRQKDQAIMFAVDGKISDIGKQKTASYLLAELLTSVHQDNDGNVKSLFTSNLPESLFKSIFQLNRFSVKVFKMRIFFKILVDSLRLYPSKVFQNLLIIC